MTSSYDLPATTWDGTCTTNAPAGTTARFTAGSTTLFTSTVDSAGRIAFFRGRPPIPIQRIEYQDVCVELDCPSAVVAFGTTQLRSEKEPYFVLLTAIDGTNHRIAIANGTITVTPRDGPARAIDAELLRRLERKGAD